MHLITSIRHCNLRVLPFIDDVIGVVGVAAEDEGALLAVQGETLQLHLALSFDRQTLRKVNAPFRAYADELKLFHESNFWQVSLYKFIFYENKLSFLKVLLTEKV